MKSVSRLFRDWIFSNSLIVIFLLLAGSMLVLTPEEQKFCGHCMTFAFLAGLFSIPIDLLLWVNM